jgi:hypothetical protein
MNVKLLGFSLIVFALASSHSDAGSFFGPPPFTNGSPLISGVAGTYQATARGKGISGLIVFSYNSDGLQSSGSQNNYVFFVEGVIVTGSTQASIQNSKITGVLDTPVVSGTNETLAGFEATGGWFAADVNTSSPIYSFKGNGRLQTYVSNFVTQPDGSVVAGDFYSVLRKFRLQGMRTSLSD